MCRNLIFPVFLGIIYVVQTQLPGTLKLGALWSDHPCWWQFFTNGFLSGNRIHLIVNMAGMWVVCSQFASQVRLVFLFLYFLFFSAISSFLYLHFFMPPHVWLVGASGGVYALIGFLCWFQRRDRVCFLGLRKLSMPFLPAMLTLFGIEFLVATFWIPVLAWQVHILAFSISIATAMAAHAAYAGIHWMSKCNSLICRELFKKSSIILRKIKQTAIYVPVTADQ
jgi:membrane associated rhomboid family serine protease